MRFKVKNASWAKRLLLVSAGVFFMKHLKGFHGEPVKVTLTMVQYLRDISKCRAMSYQDSTFRYSIRMASELGNLASIRCLAHEMIHVSQWLTGKMVDLDTGRHRVRWMKRTYSSKMAYRKHPWEIEAYKYDKAVAQKFIEFWKLED